MGVREQLAEDNDWIVADLAIESAKNHLAVIQAGQAAARFDHAETAAQSLSARALKRSLDLCIAVPLLVILAPVLFALALAVRLESSGPSLFRQRRFGRDGRVFRILKFRTLHVMEDGDQVRQVTRDDPRLTRLGRFLRRTSLDELPQLFNVIRGDMSLVGPRPHALAHDRYYGARIGDYLQRQRVKPGITGWAQIHGHRGETATLDEMRNRVGFDLWYVARADIVLDLYILLATPRAILRGKNAQ
ncbi:MAG TPA: exopolysaccharide biosynthesis polyprenyl glycosylphosphotransferase [Rhizomicrobium sp.]